MARYPGQPKESDTADAFSGELPCERDLGEGRGDRACLQADRGP